MKKIVFLLFIIILTICFINKKYSVLIPSNAIRIRVIAKSNDLKDQEMKNNIKNDVTNYLYDELKNIDSYESATSVIKGSISNIKNIINRYTDDYIVNYGENYFPSKTYKGVEYQSGNYESLVIKLGEGKGNNFWCVLFPPLCMIDEENIDDRTYTLFITELLKNIK